MAISNTFPLSLTRDEIIEYAYRKVGVVDETETPTTDQYTKGARLLNTIVTSWHTAGLPTWYMKTGYVFPKLGDPPTGTPADTILLGPSGDAASYSYKYTTASTAGTPTDAVTSIYIPLTAGTYPDQEGNIPDSTWYAVIELDDGTTEFQSLDGIVEIDTDYAEITFATVLRDNVTAGNKIYLFPSLIQRPLKIVGAWKRVMDDETDTKIDVIERDTWLSQANKYTTGSPTQVYYQPTLTNGHFYTYPQIGNINEIIVINFQHPLDIFVSSASNPAIPDEFAQAMIWALAADLAYDHSLPLSEKRDLVARADAKVGQAFSFDQEEGSIFITPNGRNSR